MVDPDEGALRHPLMDFDGTALMECHIALMAPALMAPKSWQTALSLNKVKKKVLFTQEMHQL